MLDWGPKGMSSSSPRCSLPLSRCSSSDTTFRRICSSFCSWKEAGRGAVRGPASGVTLTPLPRQRRAPLPPYHLLLALLDGHVGHIVVIFLPGEVGRLRRLLPLPLWGDAR